MKESAKLQALGAKYMLMYQGGLLADVLTCQRALRIYMLICQRALWSYVLTCQRDLRAYGLTCKRSLRTLVLTMLPPLSAYVTYLSMWLSFPSQGFCVHVITWQHDLPPQKVLLMRPFLVLLPLLLKMYTLLVKFKSLINVFPQ